MCWRGDKTTKNVSVISDDIDRTHCGYILFKVIMLLHDEKLMFLGATLRQPFKFGCLSWTINSNLTVMSSFKSNVVSSHSK